MYIVKDTPILKDKKLFKVGEQFPYSENDKHLLWNLTLVEDAPKDKISEIPETPKEIKVEAEKPKPKSKKK